MENDPASATPDPTDPVNFILAGRRAAASQAIGSLGDNPDEAARSMELSSATGVPAPVINSNLELFEQQHKAALTANLLNNNEYLRTFINSDPMAAKVANDDYARLDAISQKVSALALPIRAAGKGFVRGFGEAPIGGMLLSDKETFGPEHRLGESVVRGIASIPELAIRTLMGATFAGAYGVAGEETGENLAQVLTDPGLQASLQGIGPHGVLAAGLLGILNKAHPALPFLKNGRAPPPTILPEFDKMQAEQNVTDLNGLKEATSEAQSSMLRERNPELFKQFIEQHTDAEISVSGEVVAALYGDKLPAADDGILGWVPGIQDKLALARDTGGDIGIPLADWLARAEPELMTALHDDIRVRPGGITANEVKIQAEQEQLRKEMHEANPPPLPQEDWRTAPLGALPDDVARFIGDENVQALPSGKLIRVDPETGERYRFTTGGVFKASGEADVKMGSDKPLESINDIEQHLGKPLTEQPKQEAPPYKSSSPLPDEVASIRAGSALEPMFSIGDRKLKMERLVSADTGHFGPEQGFHDFQMLDEKGSPVGYINLSEQNGGKQIVVEMISGVNGLGPRDFGPALMRDLLRQLKAEFPNAESITGHRVSGAREKAGSFLEDSASPMVKLENPDLEAFSKVMDGGRWETYSRNIQAYIKPYAERGAENRQIINMVSEEMDRVVPNKLRLQAADRIKAKGVEGQGAAPIEPTGAYIAYKDAYPILLYALEGENPLGTARHEAIHHLRAYGFFDKGEWATLEKAASDNKWTDQFDIHDRYPNLSHPLKLEEAIADAYKEWEQGRFEAPTPEVHGLFERMKAFFEAIKDRLATMLGRPATWEDVFQKVSTGEVGTREGTPLDARAFNEKLSVPEEPTGGSRVFERATALGMTVDQFKAYDKLIQKRHAEDIAAATKRATEEKAREQTRQWKDDRKALRVEVADDIKQRPDVAADLFFGAGELYGKKVPLGSVKIDASALTEAQKEGLPRNYYGDHGLHPDDVANLFGYGSGDAMVEKLVEYNRAKLTAGGMSAKDFVSRVTDIETDRQMRIKYGVLEDNIIDAVKEQVAGETQLDILHEETVALGMKAGQAPLDKAAILGQLRENFAKMPLGSVSSDAYLRAAGKAGRQAELALLGEDPATAFRAKQQQYYATVIANEAVKLEKEVGKFDKTAKRFSKREAPSVEQEYTNFIHDILQRVGKQVRRSVQDLETEISAGEFKSLQDFVEGKNGFYLREVAVADTLFDPRFRKAFEDLTVDEFRAVDTSIKSLIANGRDEKKITKAGVAEDLDVIRAQMISQLEEFQEKEFNAKGERAMGLLPGKQAAMLRGFGIDHLQMESIFNRWDRGDPNGVFQQYVMRDLVAAANSESAKRKVYSDRLMELRGDKADLTKLVDNTLFKVPGTDQVMKLNRGNLRAILLNAGNRSNLNKMAKGYGLKPEEVQAWLHRYATAEDWQWAQKVGDLFSDLKKDADVMYRNISGVAPESISLDPIQTPHGQFPGWYYPLIAHPEFEGKGTPNAVIGKNGLEQDGFVRATTANGYTKSRTGATYPLALDLDMMPNRIGQMIHDIEMRPAVINASKIFYDKDVRSTIATRFGNEWRDMLVPYLRDVANSANYMSKSQKQMANLSEFIRQNMITTLVGLNPGTFMKHTPTALVQSIQEVGADRFLRAMRGMWGVNEATGESNWQFAMKNSEELQRRHTHFQETLGGAGDQLIPTKGFASLRSTVNYYASMPVAMGDLASAVPTWLAQYTKSMEEGATPGDAVYMADRSVRRAHGSTAITNRSAVMRGGYSPWLASVYGFFNHIMNRQYEMVWKSGEMLDLIKEGDKAKAMQEVKGRAAELWAYVLAPAIIEELVSPLSNDEHESWGVKAAKGLIFTLGASWIGVRDLANAMLHGRDPALGLSTTALKSVTDVFRDVSKDKPLSKAHAGKLVKDAVTLLGTSTGLAPAQAGKAAQFGLGVATGQERPKGPWGWMTGLRFGTIDKHPKTFDEWQRHHIGGH